MTKYKGKIALDIRDSVPDWEPFLAQQGYRLIHHRDKIHLRSSLPATLPA